MMKTRILSALLALCLVMTPLLGMAADGGQPNGGGGIVGIGAYAEVNTVYHQIAAIFVEYAQDIVAPEPGAFSVVDYATKNMKEDYDNRDFSEAPILNVYTNSVPEVREDKVSQAGRYLVIELEPTTHCVEEDGMMKPNHNAGLCTWRLKGEQSEWRRPDFSELVITQKTDVLNAAGEIVAASGQLPTLQAKDIFTPYIGDHKAMTIRNAGGEQDIHFSLYLPEGYDSSKTYPMVYNVSGNGGRLNYAQQDAEGNLVCIGSNISRDRVAIAFTEMPEETIVVSPQIWRNEPEEWGIDYVEDGIFLLEHILANYSVDPNRVYAIGSSFGTMHISALLGRRADLITAYIMSNGAFVTADDTWLVKFKEEYTGSFENKDIAYVESLGDEARLDKAEYADQAKAAMGGIIQNKVPIWVYHAVNDESIGVVNAVGTYEMLVELYTEAGLSESEINDLVKLTLLEDEAYFSMGIAERHQASKKVILEDEIMQWLYAQRK